MKVILMKANYVKVNHIKPDYIKIKFGNIADIATGSIAKSMPGIS